MKTLTDLFQDTIRDIYSSEKQLLEAMPAMRDGAQSQRLKEAIALHITETREHVRRIESIASNLRFDPDGMVCQGTVGLVKEAKEHLREFGGSPVGDAAIIACAQKNEHYEIANYGTAITFAELLGLDDAAEVLEETLQEEEETDDKLTEIAESDVNERALAVSKHGASLL